jgi:hypothetical protein
MIENLNEYIEIIKIVTNSLSILGTSLMILMIIFNKKLHTLGFYLVLNLSFSDLMFSISHLLIFNTEKLKDNDFLC